MESGNRRRERKGLTQELLYLERISGGQDTEICKKGIGRKRKEERAKTGTNLLGMDKTKTRDRAMERGDNKKEEERIGGWRRRERKDPRLELIYLEWTRRRLEIEPWKEGIGRKRNKEKE